jgi:transposase
LRVVTEWVTRKRHDESAKPSGRSRKLPSARVIAKMMTTERDHLSADDARLIVTIEKAVPDLLAARDLIDQFHAMIRKRDADRLDDWIKTAKCSLFESLANGIAADRDAVQAAISEQWSNGQTEGQITKLKLVKRQMYGRAKLDLLRARVMAAA